MQQAIDYEVDHRMALCNNFPETLHASNLPFVVALQYCEIVSDFPRLFHCQPVIRACGA